MKKLFVIALVALFIGGAIGVVYAVNPSGPGGAGDVMGMYSRYTGDAHRTFRLVRNGPASTTVWTSATALTAGNVVIWDTTQNPYGADGISVTTTTTTADSRIAGMIVTTTPTRDASVASIQGTLPVTTATEDVGQANWGWLQTYGLSAVKATQCTTGSGGSGRVAAVGEGICTSTVAGQITSFLPSTTTATINGKGGFAMETFTTGSTGYIFLRCD